MPTLGRPSPGSLHTADHLERSGVRARSSGLPTPGSSKMDSKMSPTFCPTTAGNRPIRPITSAGQPRSRWHVDHPAGRTDQTYTIFEGTSEIQRLIIARAISGIHIN